MEDGPHAAEAVTIEKMGGDAESMTCSLLLFTKSYTSERNWGESQPDPAEMGEDPALIREALFVA